MDKLLPQSIIVNYHLSIINYQLANALKLQTQLYGMLLGHAPHVDEGIAHAS